MIAVVDRIEGDLAVLEIGGRTVDWPVSALPEGVREGDRLDVRFEPLPSDSDAAQRRLDRLRSRSNDDDLIDL